MLFVSTVSQNRDVNSDDNEEICQDQSWINFDHSIELDQTNGPPDRRAITEIFCTTLLGPTPAWPHDEFVINSWHDDDICILALPNKY